MKRLLILFLLFSLSGCNQEEKQKEANAKVFQELLQKGDVAYKSQKYEEALLYYNDALEKEPESASALINRGTVYQQKNQLKLAVADYSKAIKLNPKLAEAYSNRASAYLAMGLEKLAIGDWQKACDYKLKQACDYLAKHNLLKSPPKKSKWKK